MSDPADLRRTARFLMIAAMVVDLAAVASLVLPLVQGESVTTTLPIALALFAAAAGLFVASMGMRKKAEAAE